MSGDSKTYAPSRGMTGDYYKIAAALPPLRKLLTKQWGRAEGSIEYLSIALNMLDETDTANADAIDRRAYTVDADLSETESALTNMVDTIKQFSSSKAFVDAVRDMEQRAQDVIDAGNGEHSSVPPCSTYRIIQGVLPALREQIAKAARASECLAAALVELHDVDGSNTGSPQMRAVSVDSNLDELDGTLAELTSIITGIGGSKAYVAAIQHARRSGYERHGGTPSGRVDGSVDDEVAGDTGHRHPIGERVNYQECGLGNHRRGTVMSEIITAWNDGPHPNEPGYWVQDYDDGSECFIASSDIIVPERSDNWFRAGTKTNNIGV